MTATVHVRPVLITDAYTIMHCRWKNVKYAIPLYMHADRATVVSSMHDNSGHIYTQMRHNCNIGGNPGISEYIYIRSYII